MRFLYHQVKRESPRRFKLLTTARPHVKTEESVSAFVPQLQVLQSDFPLHISHGFQKETVILL